MNTASYIILLLVLAFAGFLLYAGIRGLKTYHFPTKEEREVRYRELEAKAHELYLRRKAEKAERRQRKKYSRQYEGSIIIDVLQGKC
ncbi:MAG: hypothetical protein IJ838_00105 [Paludibacteraceae bacterium]|nr:hypothetical protein [Paludibacteraceae bacterium]